MDDEILIVMVEWSDGSRIVLDEPVKVGAASIGARYAALAAIRAYMMKIG